MATTIDNLWLAWAEKTMTIVGKMQLKFDIDLDTHARCYYDTPEGELLVVIINPSKDDLVSVDLYGISKSPQPISQILMAGDEVRIGGHGSFHRFKKADVPSVVEFLMGMRAEIILSDAFKNCAQKDKIVRKIETS